MAQRFEHDREHFNATGPETVGFENGHSTPLVDEVARFRSALRLASRAHTHLSQEDLRLLGEIMRTLGNLLRE
jgi:hypothetical protein